MNTSLKYYTSARCLNIIFWSTGKWRREKLDPAFIKNKYIISSVYKRHGYEQKAPRRFHYNLHLLLDSEFNLNQYCLECYFHKSCYRFTSLYICITSSSSWRQNNLESYQPLLTYIGLWCSNNIFLLHHPSKLASEKSFGKIYQTTKRVREMTDSNRSWKILKSIKLVFLIRV